LVLSCGFPKYRAAQLLDWIYQKNALAWDEIRNLPKEALQKIAEKTSLTAFESLEEKKAIDGGPTKFLFKTSDGHFLESVLISKGDASDAQEEEGAITSGRRETVCVSTQLGTR